MEFVVRFRTATGVKIEGHSLDFTPVDQPPVFCVITDEKGDYVALLPVDGLEAVYQAEAERESKSGVGVTFVE